MSNAPAIIRGELTADEIKILSDGGIIPKDCPAPQVALFAKICQEHGLSPFRQEMSLVKFGGVYQAIVRIDGSRKKAARTGQYGGKENAIFNLKSDGSYQTAAELKAANKLPGTCTMTVYRVVAGQRCPFTQTVVFAEFQSSSNSKWRDTPFQMIAKVAESFALKSAFGDELGGLHIQEEEAAFTGEVTSAKPAYKSEAGVQVQPVTIPEHLQQIFDEHEAVLRDTTNFDRVLNGWENQDHESEQMKNLLFAKLFYEAAARTAADSEELKTFHAAAPHIWKINPLLKQILANAHAKLTNANAS